MGGQSLTPPPVATDDRTAPAPPHSGWFRTSGQSADTTTPGVPASEGSSCGESGSRWLATTTSCCRGTPPSDPSFMSGCPGRRGWGQASSGGATAVGGSRAITCSLSVGRGSLRSGRCGEGSSGTVGGNTRGRRGLRGCGMRGLPGQCWSFWGTLGSDTGRPPGQIWGARSGKERRRERPSVRRGRGEPGPP